MYDVVSLRDLVDTKIGALILQNSRDSNIFNKEVQVRWEGEKHPARIVAIGSPAQMEKKCKLMIKGACNGAGDQVVDYCENCAALEQEKKSLKSDIDHLQEENARLKAIVDYVTSQRDVVDELTIAVQDLKNLREEMEDARVQRAPENPGAQAEGNEDEEDLGGIKVSRALLLLLDMGPTKSPTVYARELLRLVFSSEELVGKSITGKQSNAHKDKPAKPQLDPVRVNAVISYTCKKFKLLKEGPVRTSLSSLLNKEANKEKPCE